MFGTSPYRYLLMRRLEFARDRIHRERPLVEVACDAGFADQAHFTRVFKSAFGLTPTRYRALRTRQVAEQAHSAGGARTAPRLMRHVEPISARPVAYKEMTSQPSTGSQRVVHRVQTLS